MRTEKQSGKQSGRNRERDIQDALEAQEAEEPDEPEALEALEIESYDIYRVNCPDCAQPIALLAEEEHLPQHALCATPWNPFGPVVCRGSGRPAAEAAPLDVADGQEADVADLLTLPEGLDWRMQPFSHAGGFAPDPVRPPRAARRRIAARQG
ncbi:hypothetical protein [Streptomyces sp. ODS28]|uniref:hypothetical protein n=1 Tax=Streptomyces sp. ODS28 TaxID=3136688 RepID=UPI0031F1592E